MSAPVHVKTSPIQNVSVVEWRKRSNTWNDLSDVAKRPRYQYYYMLASESSHSEDDRSESVDSIQDQETDYCKDTSDTDTKSEQSDDNYDMQVEYEIVETTSESENPFADASSSGEDVLLAASAVAASIANESEVEIWAADTDDETDSDTPNIKSQLVSFQTCKKCKSRQTVSCFPLCSYCYKLRKNCHPPRPRHTKKSKKKSKTSSRSAAQEPVTKDRLSACLNVLSQDSGIASSQNLQSTSTNPELQSASSSQELQTLAWDQVVVPENLIKSELKAPTESTNKAAFEPIPGCSFDVSDQSAEGWSVAAKEMCIMCHAMPKNGIFVHSAAGHLCCCYKCAVKFWSKSKRCAWCNLKAKNVVKAFLV